MSQAIISRRATIRSAFIALIVIVPLSWAVWTAYAASRTWDGGGGTGNTNWMTAANWVGNVVPVAGDNLTFPSSPGGIANNDFPAGTRFDKLTMNGSYQLTGNSAIFEFVEASSGVISLSSLGTNFITNPTSGTSFTITSGIDNTGLPSVAFLGAGNVVVTGKITNVSSQVIVGGGGPTGTVTFSGNNTYTGSTSISSGGTLRVEGSQPKSHITLFNNGTLRGGGTTGPITGSGPGATLSPGKDASDSVLTTVGNVNLNSATTFEVVRQGTGPLGQLQVTNGAVNLGGSTLSFQISGRALAAGETITIIDNDGSDAVIGTFNGLAEGAVVFFNALGGDVYISYRGGTGNDVVLHAATNRTWDGGGPNSNWMTATNWVGNFAPELGDDLVFPPVSSGLTNNCNFPADTTFNSISINGGGYTMTGDSIRLRTGLTDRSAGSNNTVNLKIGGPGGVTRDAQSGGTLTLNADNDYTRATVLNVGELVVNGNQPASAVTVNAGTLRGRGTIGPLAVTDGEVDPSTSSNLSPADDNTLTVNGNAAFTNESKYRFRLSGFGGGDFRNNLLDVKGTVALNDCVMNFAFVVLSGLQAGSNFTVINNDGTDAVIGTFDARPEGSTFAVGSRIFGITYRGGDGNDVALHAGTTRTWDGGGTTNNWMEAANWVGDVAPGPGDDLVFPQSATRKTNHNNFPAGTTFNSITLSGGGYGFDGNSIALNAGITHTGTPASQIAINAIKLNANQTFSVDGGGLGFNGGLDTNGKRLTLDGAVGISFTSTSSITGTGGITKTGTGTAGLGGVNTYTDTTIVSNGTLVIGGDASNSAVSLTGGTLTGSGTTGPITASGGTVFPGGTTHVLSVNGSVTFNAGTTFTTQPLNAGGIVHLKRLNVNGTVALGGSTLNFVSTGLSLRGSDTFVIILNDGADAVSGTFSGIPEGATITSDGRQFRVSYAGGDGNDVTLTSTDSIVHFSSAGPSIGEAGQSIDVNITRSGDTTLPATVDFVTVDGAGAQNCNVTNGAASSRCDYVTRNGTIRFAAGETSRTIPIFIIDDSYLEGTETFNLNLSNPSGAILGSPVSATVFITDDEIANGPNPIDTAGFFVRQHYLDFFTREPDASGLAFWTNQITSCGTDQACVSLRRINVSAAFYLSIEFQQTGYLVERMYKAAYGDATGNSTLGGNHTLPVPIVRLEEFLPDTQQIGLGVVVGQTGWEQVLENNKRAFAAEFVQRERFTSTFPPNMSPALFVTTLNSNAGNPLSQAECDQLAVELTTGLMSRSQVLRIIAEHPNLVAAESNRAFVLMQFFGYLRRNPNDPQDTDYTGYDFWLTKLNQFNGNFVGAEMVKAFITSGEYRQRFGP